MRLAQSVAPTVEPISRTDTKLHLRVDDFGEDTLIDALIVAARLGAEAKTGRKLCTQRWVAYFDSFSEDMTLEGLSPVTSVLSISYIDTSGVAQTLNTNKVQLVKANPAKIVAAYGVTLPATRTQPEAVSITVECGYGNAAAVPQAIKQWMLLQIGSMYENREAAVALPRGQVVEMPFADGLLDPYRIVAA